MFSEASVLTSMLVDIGLSQYINCVKIHSVHWIIGRAEPETRSSAFMRSAHATRAARRRRRVVRVIHTRWTESRSILSTDHRNNQIGNYCGTSGPLTFLDLLPAPFVLRRFFWIAARLQNTNSRYQMNAISGRERDNPFLPPFPLSFAIKRRLCAVTCLSVYLNSVVFKYVRRLHFADVYIWVFRICLYL